jgi:hypothetical protein
VGGGKSWPGHLALFSWQTILALRVLNEIHQRYGVEVVAWRGAIAEFQALLKGRAFPSLWGGIAVFPSSHKAILKLEGEGAGRGSFLSVGLNEHLEVLASPHEFRVETQLPLFPAMAVPK